jgi:spore coat protein CotH
MRRYPLFLINAFIVIYSAKSFSQNQAGDDLFSGLTVHTINIESSLPLSVFYDSLIYYKDQENMNGDGTYMKVNITIDNETVYDAAVKFKGNSSYAAPNSGVKKSMKLDLDKYIDGQDYDGLDKLNLNNGMGDPTFLREKLTYDLFNDMGLPSPRATFANVYLNDSLWGIYTVVEIVEGTFLDNRFGEKDGNLFKGDNAGHLVWEGGGQSLYNGDYELENNDSLNDWSDLIHLLDMINNTTDTEFEDSLQSVLDVDIAIQYWAICNLLVNLDAYLGSGHNYYIYHNLSSDKFVWIPWDVNESFGGFTMNYINPNTVENIYSMAYDFLPSTGMGDERPLYQRILENNNLTNQYTDALYQLISEYVTPSIWNPKIDSMADVIRSSVYADFNYSYATSDFETNLDSEVQSTPGLKMFIQERTAYINSVLMSMGYPSSLNEENENADELLVYPNPANEMIYLRSESFSKTNKFILYDHLGKIALSKELTDQNHIQKIEINHLTPGYYSFQLFSEGEMKKGSIIIFR